MSEDRYSVIMTAFQGNLFQVHDVIPEIFGRRGLDLFAITFFHSELPSELDANRTHEDATRIVSALETYGAKVEVVPTAEVEGVLHRADELWPMRYGKHYDFLEIDGMIFSAPALNARQNLESMREKHGKHTFWDYEWFINHMHPGHPPSDGTERELIRTERRLIEDLKHDLRTIYPDKTFVISHALKSNIISFFQASEDAPKETRWTEDRSPEKTWCPQCSRPQPYTTRAQPDSEFPEADWGDCSVCGNEVLVAAPEVLILVGPEPDAG